MKGEAAKNGKTPARQPARRAGARRNSLGARSGSRRDELLTIIKQGGGLTRAEILDKMGLKGNKSFDRAYLLRRFRSRARGQLPWIGCNYSHYLRHAVEGSLARNPSGSRFGSAKYGSLSKTHVKSHSFLCRATPHENFNFSST